MCRFLLVKSNTTISPKELLTQFSNAVAKSHTPDGDLQEDGWGYSWFDQNTLSWKVYTSILPIWQESKKFVKFPKAKSFIAHARSASFIDQKGIIEFNQPFITKDYAFVFNGLLKGVSLPNIPGKIGAEKIWNIIQLELKKEKPKQVLLNLKKKLLNSSREIVALNIGLTDKNEIYSLNYFTKFPRYYILNDMYLNGTHIVCSEKIG